MPIKDRQRLLTVVALAALAIFAGDKLLFSPLTRAWKERSTQITALRQQLAEGRQLLQRESALRARWDQMRRQALPANTSQAEQQVLKSVDQWAQDSRITITAITPQWKRGTEGSMTLQCRVDASGNLPTVSRFLYEIERDPLPMKLDSVEISARDTEGQQLSLGLQLSGLVLIPDKP